MLRCGYCLIALLMFSSAAVSQQTLGSVHGRVVLGDTGGPGEGTFVSVIPIAPPPSIPAAGEYVVHDGIRRGDLHARAAADGSFEIDKLPAGDYTVVTYKPGYVNQDAPVIPG